MTLNILLCKYTIAKETLVVLPTPKNSEIYFRLYDIPKVKGLYKVSASVSLNEVKIHIAMLTGCYYCFPNILYWKQNAVASSSGR